MNRKQLQEGVSPGTHPIYQEFAEALDLVEAKAHDYAEDDNVFSNFEFAAQVAGVRPEQVFAVLLGVKVARLGQLIGQGKEPNFESIDDTLLDTMNYAGLLKAYLRKQSKVSVRQAYEEAANLSTKQIYGQPEGPWVSHPMEGLVDEDGNLLLPEDDPDAIVVGSVVRRDTNDPDSEFTYIVTKVSEGNIQGIPTIDWQDELGMGIRRFTPEQIKLA